MSARHHKPAAAVEPSGSLAAPVPTSFELTGSVALGTLLQRARAMLHLRAKPHELESVRWLNVRMLTDIGLEADAFRPEMRRQPWPH